MTPDFKALCAETTTEFPKFKIANKQESQFMKSIALVMGKRFMTNYITTIHTTVYVPDGFDRWTEASKCALLRHERVHMRQARKWTFPLYAVLYLLAYLPLGLAYFRARMEWEAYEESLAAFKDYGLDYSSDGRRAWLVEQFTSSAYGWMWPFPKTVTKWFDDAVAKLSKTD